MCGISKGLIFLPQAIEVYKCYNAISAAAVFVLDCIWTQTNVSRMPLTTYVLS